MSGIRVVMYVVSRVSFRTMTGRALLAWIGLSDFTYIGYSPVVRQVFIVPVPTTPVNRQMPSIFRNTSEPPQPLGLLPLCLFCHLGLN